MTPTHIQRSMLARLTEAGHGTIDGAGRVCIGPINSPIPGDPVSWLRLVAAGLVAGERGLIIPTEIGREAAASHMSGRTREGI
jgi:hypothetical protein